jgi:hypothetical protein
MNPIFITIKNTFTAIAARRPVSHLAAVTLLGTSVYAVHEGAAAVLPAGLAAATTAAMVGCEWLQWTALGRLAKVEDASDDVRALVLKYQCVGVGGLQVLLYTLAVVNFASEAGQNWGQGWALCGTIAIAALFAALNFIAKWTSCDQLEQRGPVGGRPVHHALFSAPALESPEPSLARYTTDQGVIDFEDALRKRGERTFEEVDPRVQANAARDADERFRMWKKREAKRRERAKAAA